MRIALARIALVVACVQLAGSIPALAQRADWRTVGFGESPDGPRLQFVDAASVSRPTPTTRLIKSVFITQQTERLDDGFDFFSMETVHRIDCPTRGLRMESARLRGPAGERGGAVEGRTATVDPDSLLGRVITGSCGAGFAAFGAIEAADPASEARFLFAQRDAVGRSLVSSDWLELDAINSASGPRVFYVDRASIAADKTLRYATLMTVDERPEDGIPYSFLRMQFDCAAKLAKSAYYEPKATPRAPGAVPGEVAKPVHPNSVIARLEAPLCRGDWSALLATNGNTEVVARNAFKQ